MRKYLRNNNGITLIALVITIIILLILAGITITELIGNGLIGKSKQSKEKYDYSAAYEILSMKISEANIDKQRKCTLEELEQFMSDEKEVEILVVEYNKTAKKADGLGDYETGKLKNIVVNVIQYKKYYFLIGENCTIDKVSNDYGKTYTDIDKFDGKEEKEEVSNIDWKEILNSAGIDSSKYSNFEEALEDSEVINAIVSNNDDMTLTEVTEEGNKYYTFLAKANEKYLIQCWGAQGGSYGTTNPGGYGGYSYGIYQPTKDTLLYIYKGGAGKGNIAGPVSQGGYNGGGSLIKSWSDGNEKRATGGGATHIATQKGLLQELENNKSSVFMVAGGGGGSGANSAIYGSSNGFGGNGGGINGEDAINYNGNTLSHGGRSDGPGSKGRAIGSFGKGGEGDEDPLAQIGLMCGGGGGYYGGNSAYHGGGGGSGYINPNIFANGKTITSNHTGDGECKITLLNK